MPWLNQVSSVLEAWYPGEQDGAAIASVLLGPDVGVAALVEAAADGNQDAWKQAGGQVRTNGLGHRPATPTERCRCR